MSNPSLTQPISALSQGFTLLEVLMVVLLVGIISGIAMLGFNPGGEERQLQNETDRLITLMDQASNEAVMQNQEIGLLLKGDSYQFLCLNESKKEWADCADHDYRAYSLPSGLEIHLLHRENRRFSLSLDDTKKENELSKILNPDLYFLSSGESIPTSFEIVATQDNSLRHEIAIDELGRVLVDPSLSEKEGESNDSQ